MRNNPGKNRGLSVMIFIAALFLVFLVNLFNIQIFESEEQKNAAVVSVNVDVPPVRGEIYDCNGYPLVTNRQVNTIIFNYLTFPPGSDAEGRNKVIDALIRLFNKNKIEWIDELPILYENGKLKFNEEKENEVSYLKSSAFLHLNYYADVEDCFDALVERYKLQSYSVKDARNIASVYYSMRKTGFNSTTPYVFAKDVSQSVVAAVKEKSDVYVGVDVEIRTERQYTDGTIAPHILGIVGSVSQEEYEANKDKGYSKNDVIGKSGIEYTMESHLRGEAGIKNITVDSAGNKTETYIKEPVQGDAIILTIDKDVQKVAQDALKDLILKQQITRANVTSGAVVVMNVKDNSILASASYPTFDISTYYDNAVELNEDKSKPLWNRALRSTYTPGSTIKPAVAMAGLEESLVDGSTLIKCRGIYTHYKDYQPGCTGHHGNQNVINALFNSCNIFFYETSRLLGIERLNNYFTMFGLGEATGVELGENEGTVDSVELRTSQGELWTPGLTIQAGIGHGKYMFTPVQLCSYESTIANKGVRYKAHFIKSVMSADYSETVQSTEPQILSKADFKNENWSYVHKGMLLVGTKSYADFTRVPVDVAAKTGTTTIEKIINGKKTDTYNGLIIAFAPYDDPEIAVAVVIEGAGSGGSTAPVASAIMEYYFSKEEKKEVTQTEDVLL